MGNPNTVIHYSEHNSFIWNSLCMQVVPTPDMSAPMALLAAGRSSREHAHPQPHAATCSKSDTAPALNAEPSIPKSPETSKAPKLLFGTQRVPMTGIRPMQKPANSDLGKERGVCFVEASTLHGSVN